MAQLPNMNWMGDQPTGSAYDVYQYYLGGGGPGGTPAGGGGGGGGIMQAYQPPGSDPEFNPGGNVFGYGTAIDPIARGAYGEPGFSGGLPGDVQQTGWGRQTDPNYEKFGAGYVRPRKEISGIASLALGVLPFGGFLRRNIENRMNPTYDPTKDLKGYRVGGMDYGQKGLYNALAGENMLFEGRTGLKTLTGKNFMGKGYLEGQLELAKKFGFENMTDEEVDAAIEKQKAYNMKKHHGSAGFKYKQMMEAKAVYDKNKALGKKDWAGEHKQKQLQAQVTAQANKEAKKRIKQGKDPDYGKTETRKSSGWERSPFEEGGMIKDLTKDPEYRGWKKMYEANPGVGSMHDKHPIFIKFYKQHERDKKKFGGLAGLLYG